MEKNLKKTPLSAWHKEHGGQMVEFGGWEMPVAYKRGIIDEHLSTRKYGGLFDISHMGRFLIRGKDTIPFLQHVLTNNALALDPGMAQYTLIPNERGGAIDDAYLYRLSEDDPTEPSGYLLVVNAANKDKDWEWFMEQKKKFQRLTLEDRTDAIGMVALQGPRSKEILEDILRQTRSRLPDPWRNRLKACQFNSAWVTIPRTGYTGEPLCFELFIPTERMREVWEHLLSVGEGRGIVPVGLGARDTLRLEAGLPLYGHELGLDVQGKEIPIYAVPSVARLAMSFSSLKGEYIGRKALRQQFEEIKARENRLALPPREEQTVPKRIQPITVTGQGIARQGYEAFANGKPSGHVTSGTMVPYWVFPETGILSGPSDEKKMRPIALAYLDADLEEGQKVEIQHRGKSFEAVIVERHLSGEAPPYARPVFVEEVQVKRSYERDLKALATHLVNQATQNTLWRQKESINLIPSETTPSLLVRLLTIMDPSGRYAEHREMKAFGGQEVFYYQGTKFIEEVEVRLIEEFREFLGCSEVETRVISGQMANAAVFSGMVDYLNRLDRKSEPRRIRKVINHHLGRGGHLSAQSMGALRDFVSIDPVTERPAVVEFPVLEDNPYQIDLKKLPELFDLHKPELIVLGKSMIIHKEPVKEIAQMISKMNPRPLIHYDMAHVLGLVGPTFQEPFKEGADIVTGSTHKTLFGSQRGVVASNMSEGTEYEELWDAIARRVFPGSLSNHHLGTLLGLLMATYEINVFKSDYQKAVVSNAKAFARALKNQGLKVEGDPRIDYTETHQVIIRVGYGKGPEVAERLEKNNVIVNYQGAPDDEGFTAASCLRTGVQEMTRFGMKEKDFGELAEYMSQVILHNRTVAKEVSQFRKRFLEMKYCLPEKEVVDLVRKLWDSLR